MSGGSKATIAFELAGITKRYGATQALDGVDLRLVEGEFVALLGPNGSGKSTLIKVLDGVVAADSGTVAVAGGSDALGVVHQDLGLVETMTVAENIFLGQVRGWVRPGREAHEATRALAEIGINDIDPHELVQELTLGRRAMVAVAKVIHHGARVVVIDEVTAGLHPVEARWLVERLQAAARLGSTVLMVTHKLGEVVDVADRFVVLLDGRVVLQEPASEVTLERLVEVMSSGRRVSVDSFDGGPEPLLLEEEPVCALRGAQTLAVGPVDLELHRGQIVGLTGQLGSGLHEIGYLVAGIVKCTRGELRRKPGMRTNCVPAHRESEGVFPEESVEFNLTSGRVRKWRKRARIVSISAMRRESWAIADRLQLKPRDLDARVSELSGGNQQKTVLGRAVIDRPELLVLCEPTRGVDVATRQEIYAQVRAAARGGAAVLVASTDLEDLLAMADVAGLVGPDGTIDRWVQGDDIVELAASLL